MSVRLITRLYVFEHKEARLKIFAVRSKDADPQSLHDVRLIRAERRSQAEAHIIAGLDIAPATQDECIELGKAGVAVEEARIGGAS
jgi:hypothetical protein